MRTPTSRHIASRAVERDVARAERAEEGRGGADHAHEGARARAMQDGAADVLRVREGANVERRVGVPRASASDERVPERTHERCDAGDDEGAMDRGWEAVDRGSGEDTQVFRLTTPASGGSRRAAAERRRETHRATTIGRSECTLRGL